MTQKEALDLTNLVINYLEGGYYHPDMKDKLKGGEAMRDSGETMFGFDRVASGSLANSVKGKEFWSIVDNNYSTHHADTQYYNDKADGKLVDATVGDTLRLLVTQMMQAQFEAYAAKWLSSAALEVVAASPALTFQFWYACWNGPGRFQKFAELINAAVADGTTETDALYRLLDLNRRSWGSWSAQRADTINNIVDEHLGGMSLNTKGGGAKWLLILLAAAGVIYFASKKK